MNTIFKMQSRTFWCIAKGKNSGYIEGVGKSGIFWHHDEIKFRNTSSNLADGEVDYISFSNYKDSSKQQLIQYMNNRTPVMLEYNQHMFSVPWKNEICGGIFLTDIKKCENELLHTKIN
jgi:hypothetical protein